LALGGATLGTNNLAVTGTTQLSSSLGIGMSPSNVLDITQNQNAESKINLLNSSAGTGAISGLWLQNGTHTALMRMNGASYTTSTVFRQDGMLLYSDGAGGLSLITGAAQPIYFGINSVEKMRLDASGNFGIGITPSAWNTFNAAQVGLLSIASYTNGDTDISSNLYYNSGWKYIGTGRSAQIKLDSSTGGGDIKFLVDATGGTAAGATAGTEAARFDSSGNLLVGTTTSSDRLVVNGNNGIRISGISTGNRALYIPSGDILFDNPSARSEVRNDGNSSSELRLSGRGFVTVYTGGSGLGTGSERARFDGNGNLGIGITTPAKPLHVYKSGPAGASPSTPEIRIQHDDVNDIGTGGSAGGILSFYNIQRDNTGWAADATIGEIDWYLSQPTSGTAQNAARILCATNGAIGGTDTSTYMAFWTASGTTWYERMRIDSGGSLCIASTSSYGGYKLSATTNGGAVAIFVNTDTGGSSQTTLVFRRNTSDVGSISTTSSATAYNTSSDARLKTNVSDAAPASALIDAIQVRQFDWKADNSHQRYGMVAQELLEVAPEAVSVPADPEQMMGVDYSKLVPMMIKTIQELTTRLAALEAK
jgi:hypothetical protein